MTIPSDEEKNKKLESLVKETTGLTVRELLLQAMRDEGFNTFIDDDGEEKPL